MQQGSASEIKAMDTNAETEENHDLVALLLGLQAVMFSYQGQQHKKHALINVQKRLYTMKQEPGMSCQDYLAIFKSLYPW